MEVMEESDGKRKECVDVADDDQSGDDVDVCVKRTSTGE